MTWTERVPAFYKESILPNLVYTRMFLAAALVALAATHCGPPDNPSGPPPVRNGEKITLPTANPNKVPTQVIKPSPTPPVGLKSLQIESPPGSILAIQSGELPQKEEAIKGLFTKQSILIRDSSGFPIALDKDKFLWRSKSQGIPLVTDGEKALVTSENDTNLSWVDLKTSVEIRKIPAEYPIPKDKIPDMYNRGAYIRGNFLIIPHTKTGNGTYDGFTVYDKNSGNRLWGTSIPSTSPPQITLTRTVLEVRESDVIATSQGGLYLYLLNSTVPSSPVALNLPTVLDSPPRPWNYSAYGDYVITAVTVYAANSESIEVSLYNKNAGTLIARTRLSPGQYNYPGRNGCLQPCFARPVAVKLAPYASPLNPVSPDLGIFVEAQIGSQVGNQFGSFFALFSQLKKELIPVNSPFIYSQTRTIQGSTDYHHSFQSLDPNALIFTQPSALTRVPANAGSRVLSLTSYRETSPTSIKTENYLYNNDAVRIVATASNTVVMANWDTDEEIKPNGKLKLYGLLPDPVLKTGQITKPRWDMTFESSRAFTFTKNLDIYVVAESVIKIESETGKATLIGNVPGEPLYAVDLGDRIAVLTSGNKLYIYEIPTPIFTVRK